MQTLEGIGVLVTANSTRFIAASYLPCCLGASESSRFGAKSQPTGVGESRELGRGRHLLPSRPGRRPKQPRLRRRGRHRTRHLHGRACSRTPNLVKRTGLRWFKFLGFGRYCWNRIEEWIHTNPNRNVDPGPLQTIDKTPHRGSPKIAWQGPVCTTCSRHCSLHPTDTEGWQ
jgi:hypothetical protein